MATIPATGGSFLPPPHLGHIQVEGDGLFLGDVSATINVNADQIVSATGSLTVQASGAGGTAGTAAVNVNGSTFGALGTASFIGDQDAKNVVEGKQGSGRL